MSRLPAKQKHRPHRTGCEKPQPGHRLQLDVNRPADSSTYDIIA
jgi:hypothetical protein